MRKPSGVDVVQDWSEWKRENYLCVLSAVDCLDTAEVVAEGQLHCNDKGELITFNERQRKRKVTP